MGVARIFQRGGHTDSYRGYSTDCHLNIVGCLLTKWLTKGGVTGTPGPPLATPLRTSVRKIFLIRPVEMTKKEILSSQFALARKELNLNPVVLELSKEKGTYTSSSRNISLIR